ncbi:hypothetical protein ES703_111264 [subsurface metagenome]
MAKVAKDKYSNVAFGRVTMGAPNVLTFEPIRFAVGVFQGVAIVVHRLSYFPWHATLRELVAATDAFTMGLVSSNRILNLYDISDPAIIDRHDVVGIGVAVENIELPIISDFTTMPEQGRILAPNPLYLAMMTQGFVAAGSGHVQIDFSFVELADKDYIELIQSQLPANL